MNLSALISALEAEPVDDRKHNAQTLVDTFVAMHSHTDLHYAIYLLPPAIASDFLRLIRRGPQPDAVKRRALATAAVQSASIQVQDEGVLCIEVWDDYRLTDLLDNVQTAPWLLDYIEVVRAALKETQAREE